jgi:hypothetical protein
VLEVVDVPRVLVATTPIPPLPSFSLALSVPPFSQGMSKGEERAPGGSVAHTLSSSDFFSLPGVESTSACAGGTSPIAPPPGGSYGEKQLGRAAAPTHAAVPSPDASIDFRLKEERQQPLFSFSPRSKDVVSPRSNPGGLSKHTNNRKNSRKSCDGVGGEGATRCDNGISTSNTLGHSRNAGGSRVLACAVKSVGNSEGERPYSRLWTLETSAASSRLNDGLTTSPANWHVGFPALLVDRSADTFSNVFFQDGRPPRRASSSIATDVDEKVWGLLQGHSPASRLLLTDSSLPKVTVTPAANSNVGGASAAEYTPTLAPSPTRTTNLLVLAAQRNGAPPPPLVSSPMAQVMVSTSSVMSLASPMAVSPNAAAPHVICDVDGGNRRSSSSTSTAGDNRFSLVMGMDSLCTSHPSARPPFLSNSYLRFMPLEEQSFLPDEVWECSISDPSPQPRVSDPDEGVTRSPSRHTSPTKNCAGSDGDKHHTGSATATTAVAAVPTSAAGARTEDNNGAVESTLVDDLMMSRYFDGMLPMMLQCGDAMLQTKQRREARREAQRRARGVRGGMAANTSAAASGPALSTRPVEPSAATTAAETEVTWRCNDDDDDDFGDNPYGLDAFGTPGMFDEATETTKGATREFTVSALLAQATGAAGGLKEPTPVSNSNVRLDALFNGNDSAAKKVKSDCLLSDVQSMSSAMREVEELMVTLDVMPALSWCAPSADALQQSAVRCDGHNYEEDKEERQGEFSVLRPPPAAPCSRVVSNGGGSAAVVETPRQGDRRGNEHGDLKDVAMPHFSPEVRSRKCCQAVAATAAPLPTWSLPSKYEKSASNDKPAAPSRGAATSSIPSKTQEGSVEWRPPSHAPSARRPSRRAAALMGEEATPAFSESAQPAVAADGAGAMTATTIDATRTRPPSTPASAKAADVAGAGERPPSSTSSHEPQQQLQSCEEPQTIAAMLRARAVPTDRVAPFALLVGDDVESVWEASLSMQRSAQGPEMALRGITGKDSHPLVTSITAGQDITKLMPSGVLDGDWQATEKLVFSNAARRTSSQTVPAMASLVASGFHVSLLSLHARRTKPSDMTAWGTLFPEFFASFFQTLAAQNKLPSQYSAKLSVALLKCDLYRDLLSDVVRFTPVTLLGTPLLGARLEGLLALPVYNVTECLRTLYEAHERLSEDDYANGSIVVTLTLKQHDFDAATGDRRDVLLSSFTTFASNVEVYSDIVQADRLPATAELVLQLFRGPVQAAVAVFIRHLRHNAAELRRALELQRLLRSRLTLAPRVGSVVSLLGHIRNELRSFWDVLEASMMRAAERRRVLIEAAESTSLQRPPPTKSHRAWEDEAYCREREQRAQLRYVLHALTCLGNDCKNVLTDSVTKLPPVYMLSRRSAGSGRVGRRGKKDGFTQLCSLHHPCYNSSHGRDAANGHGHEHIKQAYGVMSLADLHGAGGSVEQPKRAGGGARDIVSDGSRRAAAGEEAAAHAAAAKNPLTGKRARRRSTTAAVDVSAVLNWTPSVPQANLFAGDSACGWRGIRPLFRSSDPHLSAAFHAAGTSLVEMGAMQTVVYLEVQEPGSGQPPSTGSDTDDRLRRGATLPSGKAKSGVSGFTVNNIPVGTPRALRGMPQFFVEELCVRNLSGNGTGSRITSLSGAGTSSLLRTPPLLSGEGSGSSGSSGSVSTVVKAAFRGFLEGQNVAILSVTESSAEADAVTRMMRSPLWLAMRELVETTLQGCTYGTSNAAPSPQGRQALYMSITQPLSIDCVKDHLSSYDDFSAFPRATKSGAHHGVSTNDLLSLPNAEEVMAFQSAWTPAGPVVAGASHIPITSVAQFYKVTRELPSHVRAVADARQTESLGGTHVLVSFLLRRSRPVPMSASTPQRGGSGMVMGRHSNGNLFVTTPPAKPHTASPRQPARVATNTRSATSPFSVTASREDVFFTSATVLLSTESLFWNTLELSDHVPPSHPLNLLRPLYCHRVLNVVDVAANAVDRAWPLLLTQERMARRIRFPLWRVPWSLQAYTTYLATQRDTIRWSMANLVTAEQRRGGGPVKRGGGGRLYIDVQQRELPEWVRGLFYGKRVWQSDVAATLRQVELMYAIGIELLEGRCLPQDSWCAHRPRALCDRPMALFDGKVMYDVTTPPRVYVRTPLDPLPSPCGARPTTSTDRPTAPKQLRKAGAPSDLDAAAEGRRAEQLQTPASPEGGTPVQPQCRAATANSGNTVAEGGAALLRFVQKHGTAGGRPQPPPQRQQQLHQARDADPRLASQNAPPPLRGVPQPDTEYQRSEARYSPLKLVRPTNREETEALQRQRLSTEGSGAAPSLTSAVVEDTPEVRSRRGATAAAPHKADEPTTRVATSALPGLVLVPSLSPRTSNRLPLPTTPPIVPASPGKHDVDSSTHSTNRTQGVSSLFGSPAVPSSMQTPSPDPQRTPPLVIGGRRLSSNRPREEAPSFPPTDHSSRPLRFPSTTPAASHTAASQPSVQLARYAVVDVGPTAGRKFGDSPPSSSNGPVGASVTVVRVDSASRPRSAVPPATKTAVNALSRLQPHPPRRAESFSRERKSDVSAGADPECLRQQPE